MNASASISSRSLFEPGHQSVLLEAISWVEATLLGPLATIVAVIAVGILGFLMLRGRLVLRDGVRVFLGCFILFGAASIAAGIRSLADGVGGAAAPFIEAPEIAQTEPLEVPDLPDDYDPYAGASMPRRR